MGSYDLLLAFCVVQTFNALHFKLMIFFIVVSQVETPGSGINQLTFNFPNFLSMESYVWFVKVIWS